MKFKLILFSLIITSLFLVSAFESEVYHIGIGIPSSDEKVDVRYSSGDDSSSGGSSRTTQTHWKCGEWGECVDRIQKRNCEDIDGKRPDKTEFKECSVELEPLGYGGNNEIENENSEKSNYQSYLTSAVTGVTDFAKSKKGIAFFSVLIGIVLLLIIMKIYRLKFKN